MSGNLGADGMELGAMLKVITDNNSQKVIGEQIWVDNAKELTIYVEGTTTFRGGNNIFSYIENNINKAIKYTYNLL